MNRAEQVYVWLSMLVPSTAVSSVHIFSWNWYHEHEGMKND